MVERELQRVIGLERAPEWLECQTVLGLRGRAGAERRWRYRAYVETAVREGLKKNPWESVREQVVLGGADFLAGLRTSVSGNEQEQRGARRLCGLKLTELAQEVGLRNYVVVAANDKRYEKRLARDRTEKARMKQVLNLFNCEM